MRLIIEDRLEGDQASSAATEAAKIVAVVERQDRSVAGLGLTLAEGRALLAEVQSVLVSHQAAGRRLDGGPAGMLPLWLSSGAQGHPIDRDAHGVWQSRDTEPEAVDV